MTGHGAKIGRKTEAAIAALLSHRSIHKTTWVRLMTGDKMRAGSRS